MKYAAIKLNDVANAPGIALSFYTQGCPHHCENCFNPETWDPNGGQEFTQETLDTILNNIRANGIHRSLCVLGGEPLSDDNALLTQLVIDSVKEKYPDTPVYVWTGYTLKQLLERNNKRVKDILKSIDYLIDGPYIESLKNINLPMRGSSNQQVINLHKVDLT